MTLKRATILALLAAVTVGGAALLQLWPDLPRLGPSPAAQARQQEAFVMPAPVTPVIKRTAPIIREYVASTEAVRSVSLQAKVTGYLLEKPAADGADVEKGALLYKIDPRDYQVALDQAKAQEQRDMAASGYARLTFNRNSTLTKNGWASKSALDQTQSALQQSEASLAADKAAIEAAELNLGYTEIRAPFAGRLSRSALHEGALISVAGAPLNTLVQLDPIYVVFSPSETDIPLIQKHWPANPATAEIMMAGEVESSCKGELTFMDSAVDRGTGTIVARATVSNPERKLLPGQFVRVRLHLGERPDALFAPQESVGSAQMGKYLYVVGPGDKVEQRFVTLGPAQGDLVAVAGNLREGEMVITGNLQKIGPGAVVKPMPQGGEGQGDRQETPQETPQAPPEG